MFYLETKVLGKIFFKKGANSNISMGLGTALLLRMKEKRNKIES